MINVKHRWSFLAGSVFGGAVACVLVLYAAQLASPLWVAGKNVRRTFDLEQEAKAAYRGGDIDKSLALIRAAAVLRRGRERPISESQWSFTYPVISLYLYLGGIDRHQFAGVSQSDKIQSLYGCVEVYLLMKSGVVSSESGRRIKQLEIQYPQASVESCSIVAKAYFESNESGVN